MIVLALGEILPAVGAVYICCHFFATCQNKKNIYY